MVNFEMEGPPGPMQLVAAWPRLDQGGPQQDHPRQTSRRHHSRRDRAGRPARHPGRPRLPRRLPHQGRPPPTRSSSAGPASTGAHSVVLLTDDRQGEHADGKDHPLLHRHPQHQQGVRDQHRRRVPEPQLPPPPPAQGRRRRGDLGRRVRPPPARPHGALPRHHPGLPGTLDRRPRRQRDVHDPRARRPRRAAISSRSAACSSATRDDKRSCLLLGVQRDDEMILNPTGAAAGPLEGRRRADRPPPGSSSTRPRPCRRCPRSRPARPSRIRPRRAKSRGPS